MSKQRHHRAALALALAYTAAAGGLMSLAGAAHATPVTINYAGFFLDTIGTNTLGLAGGGSALGVPSTLFVGAPRPTITPARWAPRSRTAHRLARWACPTCRGWNGRGVC